MRIPGPMFAVFAVLLALTVLILVRTPTGFIPAQDQGNVIAAIRCRPAPRWSAPTR